MRVPIAERRAPPLQRLAVQRLGGIEVALGLQQQAQVVDRAERVRVAVAERLAARRQRLAEERRRAVEVALGVQQAAQVVDREERARVAVCLLYTSDAADE